MPAENNWRTRAAPVQSGVLRCRRERGSRGWGRAGSLDFELAVNIELFHALAQCGARDAEQFRRLHLVAAGFLERLNNQFAFDGGNEFQLGILDRKSVV